MQKRIFQSKWPASMKEMISNMSDDEYEEWEKSLGLTEKTDEKSQGQSYQITESDIEAWAKGKSQ